MNTKIQWMLWLLFFGLGLPAAYSQEEELEEDDLGGDESGFDFMEFDLLDEEMSITSPDEDVMVSTSGRQETLLSEVPETMFVLNQDQIRASGVNNIAEALRLVPGMDVIQILPGHYEVNIHDHEEMLPERILVMIDSQPVFMPFLGTVVWHALPVVLEEVERIEVILGPGSTLYGTNAFRGIINIITKTPEQDLTMFRALTGPQINDDQELSWKNLYLSTVWSKRWDRFSMRAAGSYLQQDPWEKGTYSGRQGYEFRSLNVATLDVMGRLPLSSGGFFSTKLSCNILGGDYYIFSSRQPLESQTYLADVRYEQSAVFLDDDFLDVKLFFRNHQFNTSMLFVEGLPLTDIDVIERSWLISAMYRFTLAEIFSTTVGMEERMDRFESQIIDSKGEGINYFSIYLQEKARLFSSLILTAGLRLQGRWLVDNSSRLFFVPSGSMVFIPADGHVIRVSVGQAFRNPALLEHFAKINLELAAGTLPLVTGDPNLTHEVITSVEAGYEFQWNDMLTAKINFYYSVAKDRIGFGEPTTPSDYLYGWITIAKDQETMGGEFSTVFTPWNWLQLGVGYSLVHISSDEDTPYDIPRYPMHKVTGTIQVKPLKNLGAFLSFYYMSTRLHLRNMSEFVVVNPLAILNLQLSYEFMPRWNLVAVGYNLLDVNVDNGYGQTGIDTEHQESAAERIGRRIMLGLDVQY